MNETLQQRSQGLTGYGIRAWGIICLVVGIAGRSLIENRMLGIDGMTAEQIFKIMEEKPGAMTMATIALICRAICTCAAPIFAFLLVEGFRNSRNVIQYMIRVGILAVCTEIPYDLAFTGKVVSLNYQNPVQGLLVCLIVLWFYDHYSEKTGISFFIKAVVTVAAMVWINMLRIEDGSSLLVLTAVLWAVREKPTCRWIAGVTAGFACSLFSPFYMASPMSVIAIHLYNGEQGNSNKVFHYLLFPLALIFFYGVGMMIM